MINDEVYSLEKRCRRGEIILVNPKDWRIYDIFLEDDDNTVSVHRCIDSEIHEDESIWTGKCEAVVYGKYNEIIFNNELTLFIYKQLQNNINYE